jgi:hypothetical protein
MPVPVITALNTPTHELGTTRFTSLATPSRGSTETSVWVVEIACHTPPTPHALTREEIFVVLAGTAAVIIEASRAPHTREMPSSFHPGRSSSSATPTKMGCCGCCAVCR